MGGTDRTLKERFSEHKGYVRTKNVGQTTGAHFNLPGHSIDEMMIIGIEKIINRGPQYGKEMEKENISKSTLAFLDTSCSIVEGKIVTDLYRKPTDRNMYLLPSEFHSLFLSPENSQDLFTGGRQR